MGQKKMLVILAGAALGLSATTAMAQQSSDEVRATVAEMLADVETRSSLLSSGDAGHDGRFFISGDGFRLNIGGMVQARYVANFRDDDNNEDDFESGFQMRRVRLNFQGDINKDWFYRVRGNFDQGGEGESSGGGFGLDYGYAGYKFANGTRLTVGQFKLPMLREELVGDERQLAAERSVTNFIFTQDYSQGAMLDYETENWRIAGAFSDGLATRNTDFTNNQTGAWAVSGNGLGEADYAFTGRFEYLFSGGWKQFDDFTGAKGQDFGFMMGAAAHWQESANTKNPSDVDTDTFQFTVDASVEGDSWNLFAAYIGRYTDATALNAGETDSYDQGVVIQGGWRFAENTEIFGRYDVVIFDEDNFTSGDDTFNFLTFGVNQYWAGHAAKGTLDLVWSFDKTRPALTGVNALGTATGILGDVEENEVVVRAQFQLLF